VDVSNVFLATSGEIYIWIKTERRNMLNRAKGKQLVNFRTVFMGIPCIALAVFTSLKLYQDKFFLKSTVVPL
jgi:hypothetical protein